MPPRPRITYRMATPETNVANAVITQLIQLLDGGQAHATFADAVKDFPESLHGVVPQNLPYSAWQIVEHLRITQRDILDFTCNTDGSYQPRKWPDEYWPKDAAPTSNTAWQESIQHIREDRKQFDALLHASNATTLNQAFPWGDGQTLLREALLIADHNAYHVGELIVIRRLLGAWKK